jgi:hypothetical protein
MAYNQMQPDALLQVGQALIVRPPTETPTPTPTSTPEATPTLTPEVVTVQPLSAANRLQPTAVALAAVTPTPSIEENPPGWSWLLGIGAMIAALGLTVLAAVAIFIMRRD